MDIPARPPGIPGLTCVAVWADRSKDDGVVDAEHHEEAGTGFVGKEHLPAAVWPSPTGIPREVVDAVVGFRVSPGDWLVFETDPPVCVPGVVFVLADLNHLRDHVYDFMPDAGLTGR